MRDRNQETRNSSIELLRIIMAMGVIVLHYNNAGMGGGFKFVEEGSSNHLFLFFSESLFICAVNVFIMISGYYLCTTEKRNFIRVVELIIQVIISNFVAYIVFGFRGEIEISIRGIVGCFFPINYYVILYSALYLISPYINLLIKRLDKDIFRKFVILSFLIFSVYTFGVDYAEKISGLELNGLSTVGLHGSSGGYTIVNFILIYIIGAYIRINIETIKRQRVAVVLLSMILGVYVITIFEYKSGLGYGTVWNYNNPMIIIISACVLLLFREIKIYSKIINELAKGAFTCFLFHVIFFKYFNIEEAVAMPLPILILHQIIMVITIYIVSYLIYKLYSLFRKPIIKLISPFSKKIDEILLDNLN